MRINKMENMDKLTNDEKLKEIVSFCEGLLETNYNGTAQEVAKVVLNYVDEGYAIKQEEE